MLMLILHSISILILSIWSLYNFKILKTKLTIHNLPLILLTGLGLFVTVWLAMNRLDIFLSIGIFIGVAVFLIYSFPVPGVIGPSLKQKIGLFVLYSVFWPEMIVLLWLVFKQVKILDKIKNNAKP